MTVDRSRSWISSEGVLLLSSDSSRRSLVSTTKLAAAVAASSAVGLIAAEGAHASGSNRYYDACAKPKVNHFGANHRKGTNLWNDVITSSGHGCSGTGHGVPCGGSRVFDSDPVSSVFLNCPTRDVNFVSSQSFRGQGTNASRVEVLGRLCHQCAGTSVNLPHHLAARSSNP